MIMENSIDQEHQNENQTICIKYNIHLGIQHYLLLCKNIIPMNLNYFIIVQKIAEQRTHCTNILVVNKGT